MFDQIADRHTKQLLVQQCQQHMLDWKTKTEFPQGDVPLGFAFLVNKAFRHIPPPAVKMELPPYIALRAILNNCYNMLDFGTILYVLQNSRQVDLDMSDEEYIKFLNNLQVLMVKWQQMVTDEEMGISAAMEKAELEKYEAEKLKETNDYKKNGKTMELPVAGQA